MSDQVKEWLRAAGWPAAVAVELLTGGSISTTVRLNAAGRSVIVKEHPAAPPELYRREAQSLEALRASGSVSVPEVLAVFDDALVLEDLGGGETATPGWEQLGREVAQLHLTTATAFGFPTANFLGTLPQRNAWTSDGHEFFAVNRIIRYLDEPLVDSTVSPDDRRRLTWLAEHLSRFVPPQPASLLHGDLWHANIVGRALPDTAPALVDPACYYGWAEAELSMAWGCGRIPEAFWSEYQQVRPLDNGWQDRMPLLHVREHLSMLAHFGDRCGAIVPGDVPGSGVVSGCLSVGVPE